MIKLSKRDPWLDTSMGEPFQLSPSDAFAPVDDRGTGLKGFIDRQTRAQATDSGSNTTLVPGKLYLRQFPSGTWELLRNRGRGRFDCFPSESHEELLEFAETLQ